MSLFWLLIFLEQMKITVVSLFCLLIFLEQMKITK